MRAKIFFLVVSLAAISPASGQAQSDLVYLQRGRDLYRQGDIDNAIANFNEMSRLRPNNLSVHFWLGLMNDIKGDNRAAIAEYRKCLDLAASIRMDCPEARINMANTMSKENYLKEAVAGYERGLDIDKRYTLANLGIGCALAASGDYQSALTALDRYQSRGGSDLHLYFLRGLCQAALGQSGDATTNLRAFMQNARTGDATTGGNTTAAARDLAASILKELSP